MSATRLFAPAPLPVSSSSSSSSSLFPNDKNECRKQLRMFYIDRELMHLWAKQQNDNEWRHPDLSPGQTQMLKMFTPDEQREIAAEAYAAAQQRWDADISSRRRLR